MKNLHRRLVAIIFVLLFAPLATVMAETSSDKVLIIELQTGGSGTGTAAYEFVELYNPNNNPIDVTGWKLQYRAATKLPTDPVWPALSTTTITCAVGSQADCKIQIAAQGSITVAAVALGLSDTISLNGGFADAGGQIRLIDASGSINDFVGYGTAVDFETAAAPKPAGGESLKRKVGPSGNYVDTNNNALDFTLGCGAPTPAGFVKPVAGTTEGCPLFEPPAPVEEPPTLPEEPPIVPEPPVEEAPDSEDVPEGPTEPAPEEPIPVEPEVPAEEPTPVPETPELPEPTPLPEYLPMVITELLPDPGSPQTDAADEFVELYNPNTAPVDLNGYVLKTGEAFERSVALPAVVVLPGEWVVITSAVSSLSLVNTGTAMQLVDPAGALLSEAPNYQQAEVGQSWARNGEVWQWSSTPTPGFENVFDPLPPIEETPPINEEEVPPQEAPDEPPEPNTDPVVYLPVILNELLSDPEKPADDSTDEFIELYNPNPEPVNLKGYQIQAGKSYRYKYVLPEIVIGPGQYTVITSEMSGIALSNSGSVVRLLDPAGFTVDELADYGKAPEGQSWSKTPTGSWQWSITPTPGQTNQITAPQPKKPKAATQKKSTKAATKTKTPSVSRSTDNQQSEDTEPVATEPANYWLLAGVGTIAAGYGVYEYRQGLTQGVRKLWQLVRGKNPEE